MFPFQYISMKKYKGSSLKRSLNFMSWAVFWPQIFSFMVLLVMFSQISMISPRWMIQSKGQYLVRQQMPRKLPQKQEQRQMALLFWKEYWLWSADLPKTPKERWFSANIFSFVRKIPLFGSGSLRQIWQQSQYREVILLFSKVYLLQYMQFGSKSSFKGPQVGGDQSYYYTFGVSFFQIYLLGCTGASSTFFGDSVLPYLLSFCSAPPLLMVCINTICSKY